MVDLTDASMRFADLLTSVNFSVPVAFQTPGLAWRTVRSRAKSMFVPPSMMASSMIVPSRTRSM